MKFRPRFEYNQEVFCERGVRGTYIKARVREERKDNVLVAVLGEDGQDCILLEWEKPFVFTEIP
jgi:hypothetical protein